MKKSVKIMIVVGVILLAILLVGGYFFLNDRLQRGKLWEEFDQIEKLANAENFDIKALEEKTGTIVTTGKYASIEKAAKQYAIDIFHTAYEMKTLLEDEKMVNILTADNYQKDGPEFTETKAYLAEVKKQLEEGKNQMLGYLQEDKIKSYITAETDNPSTIDLYKVFIEQDVQVIQKEKEELEESMEQVMKVLNTEQEIIDFLVTNQGKWEVQNGMILFSSNQLVQTYNDFLSQLR